MTRALILATLVGCGSSPPPATAPPAAPAKDEAMNPAALCARLGEIAKATKTPLSDKQRERCLEQANHWAADDKPRYRCVHDCVTSSADMQAFGKCESKCEKTPKPDDEAYRFLGSIETGNKVAFQEEFDLSGKNEGPFVHRFCPSTKPVPATLPAPNEKVTIPASEWNAPGWKCLRVSLDEPTLFQYTYEWNGLDGVQTGYVAMARRKLPDGKTRVIRLEGKGSAMGEAVRVSLTINDE